MLLAHLECSPFSQGYSLNLRTRNKWYLLFCRWHKQPKCLLLIPVVSKPHPLQVSVGNIAHVGITEQKEMCALRSVEDLCN